MEILTESIVSMRDGSPRVNITWREESVPLTLDVEQARALAMAILESAEAAEQDAFLVSWANSEFGNGDKKVGLVLLQQYRKARAEK